MKLFKIVGESRGTRAMLNMNNTIKLEIVTPDGLVYSEPVEMVTLQGSEGEIGILPHHTPEIAQLAAGKMIVQKNGRKDFLAVGEGMVLVSSDLVAVVTDMAVAENNAGGERRGRLKTRVMS